MQIQNAKPAHQRKTAEPFLAPAAYLLNTHPGCFCIFLLSGSPRPGLLLQLRFPLLLAFLRLCCQCPQLHQRRAFLPPLLNQTFQFRVVPSFVRHLSFHNPSKTTIHPFAWHRWCSSANVCCFEIVLLNATRKPRRVGMRYGRFDCFQSATSARSKSTMGYWQTGQFPRTRARKIQINQTRQWKPWEKSTGPRSEEGKANSAGNARKHGMRSREWLEQLREVNAFLSQCKGVYCLECWGGIYWQCPTSVPRRKAG